jgi:hypothetical protein
MKDNRPLYCAWDICEKQLRDMAFICAVTGRYFCDDYCCERALRDETPREVLTWQYPSSLSSSWSI